MSLITKVGFTDFITKNKVFLTGLVSAIGIAIQQTMQPVIDWKVIGYAALIAALSFIGNQWRGQGVTIAGLVGTLAYTFVDINQNGHFTWNQFVAQATVAILALVAPPPKDITYEKSPTITQAKEEAQTIKEEQKKS